MEVFLRFDLLLKAIHLHMQLGELFIQLLVVLNDCICLLLFCQRNRDWARSNRASACLVFSTLALLAIFRLL